ncbi:MAG: hypothetical protein NTV23_11460 [Propionibacteriales bacterium]|nr:hypothetical protein [Propionibacteriales bacterium]
MRIRRIASTASVLVLAAALVGCGGSDNGSNDSSGSDAPSSTSSGAAATVLTSAQVKDAIISLDDLGDAFVVDRSKDDNSDDDTDLGCLNDIDKVLDDKSGASDFDDAEEKAEVEYKADSEFEMPFVMSSAYSLKSTDDIEKGFTLFEDAFADCTKVDTTDKDGTRIRLDITTDKDQTDGATSQVNLKAAGSFSIPGPQGQTLKLPFYLRMSLVQVKNNIALVGFGSLVEPTEGDEDSESLNVVAVNRLLAAIKGEPAPDAPDLDLRIISTDDVLGSAAPGQA